MGRIQAPVASSVIQHLENLPFLVFITHLPNHAKNVVGHHQADS